MSTTIRQQRVSELLFEELGILIANELKDPRLSYVDVTHVRVSPDLRSARVYVYHWDKDVPREQVLKALKKAAPFLRSQLAARCGLRQVPELLFYYDDTPEQAARVDQILAKIAEERAGREEAAESTPEALAAASAETPSAHPPEGPAKEWPQEDASSEQEG